MTYNPICYLTQKKHSDLLHYLSTNDFRVYELDGENIFDRNTFNKAICEKLPQDPPLYPEYRLNLDGFIDSVSGGLLHSENEDDSYPDHVAIVWNRADKMMKHSKKDFELIIECFQDIIDRVSFIEHGPLKPVKLLVFLLEEGNDGM